MKTTLVLLAVLATAIAAPTEDITDIETQRIKKSAGYGVPALPCGSNPLPYAPVTLYLGPQVAPGSHYKESEGKNEEDMSARTYEALSAGGYSGGYAGGAAGYGGGAGHSSGPAVGLFPNANIGGCSVPLLLSCSPNVVSGHLVASHGYAAPAPAYKSNEEEIQRQARQSLEGGIASHHKVSEDFPEALHPGNHHVVSKDYPQPNVTKLTVVQQNNELNKKKLE